MKIKFILALLVASLIGFTSFAQCGNKSNNHHAQQTSNNWHHQKDIVDIAVGDDDFSTLVAALKTAGLVGTLQSDGPFTVFAPVNAAFAKLPEGTVESLLQPENRQTLTKVLTYHVVAGKFNAADVVAAIKNSGGEFKIETVSGDILTASLSGGTVLLTDEKGNVVAVTQTDVSASNGVIHVIDSVVLPS
ncbi:fasciclin domain-containing protein [Sanyastnella coralliicola]|uniref:fasciclin domain-containing protein n=1 Tax=Sanyastnella coralliicola TaxID=3069118 RepID=UPI0027BABAB9|nr:fasciclin domain-containing protein [Longitalea sp. SCSIO 12813]